MTEQKEQKHCGHECPYCKTYLHWQIVGYYKNPTKTGIWVEWCPKCGYGVMHDTRRKPEPTGEKMYLVDENELTKLCQCKCCDDFQCYGDCPDCPYDLADKIRSRPVPDVLDSNSDTVTMPRWLFEWITSPQKESDHMTKIAAIRKEREKP